MQRRQLWMLNTVLGLSALVLVWRLAGEWKRGNERYAQLSQLSGGSGPAYVLPTASQPALSSGGEVVAKNLFTPDRNNTLAAPAPAAAPAPPVVFGTIQLGPGYEALMAEDVPSASRGFRRVKSGEQIGSYTVVEIRDEKVVVEFQGQRTTIEVYQSARSVARAEARTVPAPAPGPVVETVSSPAPPSAAAPQTGASHSYGPGVRMTIEGNRRRFERDSPFGPQVWFEDIPR